MINQILSSDKFQIFSNNTTLSIKSKSTNELYDGDNGSELELSSIDWINEGCNIVKSSRHHIPTFISLLVVSFTLYILLAFQCARHATSNLVLLMLFCQSMFWFLQILKEPPTYSQAIREPERRRRRRRPCFIYIDYPAILYIGSSVQNSVRVI